MSRFLWLIRLLAANLLGWGALAWLLGQASPQDARARLAFVLALGLVVYGLVGLLARGLGHAIPRLVGGLPLGSFGDRQGAIWAGLVTAFVLLRLSGELSAITTVAALGVFAYAQWVWLGRAT